MRLTVPAILACVLMIACTRWGVGITPDSSTYIEAARNLLAGHGFTVFGPDGLAPMTRFPPLYSYVLAGFGWAGIETLEAARWFNIVLFSANTVLVGMLVRAYTRSSRLAVLAAAVFLTSEISIESHSQAWTEPGFIFLVVFGFYLLSVYFDRRNHLVLLFASVTIALAFLTRYAGAAVVLTGVLSILFRTGDKKRRFLDALMFLIVTTVPVGLWLIRNAQLTDRAADRALGFYPPSLNTADTIQLLIPLVFVLMAFLARRSNPVKALAPENAARSYPSTLTLFVLVYVLFLVCVFIFIDPYVAVTNRLFAPIYVAMMIVALSYSPALPSLVTGHKVRRRVLFGFGGVLLVVHLFNATMLVNDRYTNGAKYGGKEWRESRIIAYLDQMEDGRIIYSNGRYAVTALTGRPAIALPRKMDVSGNATPNVYARDVQKMKEWLETKNGVVAYFRRAHRAYWPSAEELTGSLPLESVFESDEGAVYVLGP